MSGSLADWISTYQTPTGRRELAQRQIATLAKAEGWNELAQHCRQAVSHEQKFRAQRRVLAGRQNQPSTNPRFAELDPVIDRTVGAIYRIASEAMTSFDRGEMFERAKDLVERLFPAGAAGITRLAYPEQAAEVKALVDALQGPFKESAAMLGVLPYVTQLATLNREFTNLLLDAPKAEATQEEVRALDTAGQRMLLQTIAMVLGRYCKDSTEHTSRRLALLQPIVSQNEALRQFFRARRAVSDVDPETPDEAVDGVAALGGSASVGTLGGAAAMPSGASNEAPA